MWQANSAKPKFRKTLDRRQVNRGPLHIHRVEAEIQLAVTHGDEPSVHTRMLLNDMSNKGVGLYSPIAFLPGQEVVIRLQDPRACLLRGRIAWCREFNVSQSVLSINPFNYRMGIRFLFESLEEERLVISICELIKREYTHSLEVL